MSPTVLTPLRLPRTPPSSSCRSADRTSRSSPTSRPRRSHSSRRAMIWLRGAGARRLCRCRSWGEGARRPPRDLQETKKEGREKKASSYVSQLPQRQRGGQRRPHARQRARCLSGKRRRSAPESNRAPTEGPEDESEPCVLADILADRTMYAAERCNLIAGCWAHQDWVIYLQRQLTKLFNNTAPCDVCVWYVTSGEVDAGRVQGRSPSFSSVPIPRRPYPTFEAYVT